MKKPHTASFSALDAYDQCPLKDYLTNILKKKSPKPRKYTKELKLGNDAHGLIEKFFKGEIKLNVVSRKLGPGWVPRFRDLASRYVDKQKNTVHGIEKFASWPILKGEYTFWARIDYWFLAKGHLTIIDWKTGKLEYAKQEQLQWNILATCETFGLKPRTVEAMFIGLKPLDEWTDHEDTLISTGKIPARPLLAEAKREIRKRAMLRWRDEKREPKEGWSCSFCDWNGTGHCPLKP